MSDTFQSTLGVKQGCPLSPTLFGIYIDDFQAELETAGGDLDLPTLCGVQAPALFYADDLDLVSTSVRGLQAQLELLESFCTRWRLTVNVSLFVCLFVFYRGRPDQGSVQEQSPAAQCGISRVNVRAAR